MNNSINVNYMSGIINQYAKTISNKNSITGSITTMSDAIEKASSDKIIGVDETSEIKPISKEDMSIEEYKQYIFDTISSFPLHPSQANNSYSINISDAGFEAMKNDPEYEKWVLDDLKGCFAMPVPAWYQAIGGPPTYSISNYGASKEEYSGRMFPIGNQKKAIFDSHAENSFWSRRAEKRQILEEQLQKNAAKKRQMQKIYEELAEKKRLNHRQAMQEYYNNWVSNKISLESGEIKPISKMQTASIATAIASYESNLITLDIV